MNYPFPTRKISTKNFVTSLKAQRIVQNDHQKRFYYYLHTITIHAITYYCVRKSVLVQFVV